MNASAQLLPKCANCGKHLWFIPCPRTEKAKRNRAKKRKARG